MESMTFTNEPDSYHICIVQCKNGDEESTNRLQLAFEAMESNELNPEWISEEACLKVKKKEGKLFVLDPFKGKVFNHLQKLKCRIVGPLCILGCLQANENLPKRQHPVYSIAMRGITATCSNLDKSTRESIWEKVEFMSGISSRDFTKSVSHLIVGEVGSKKYHVAASFGLPIMLPEWVTELWERGQYSQIHGTDSEYNRFRCPIFKGLSITVSQLPSAERNKYKALIESNGGRYSGSMKCNDTTHLVLLEPKGEKFKFAQSWKLYCVKTSWINDSINSGYCMDENLYKFEASEMPPPFKKSTPVKDREDASLVVNCSAINASIATHLDETTRTEMNSTLKDNFVDALDAFDVTTLPKFGQFLDGCKIYLSGFKSAHLEKLRKIVNAGGGIRFSKFSESVSHVICGGKSKDLLQMIETCSVKPNVVTSDWLLECCKRQKLVDEGPYICSDAVCLSPAKEPTEESKTNAKSNTTVFSKDLTLAEDFTEILKQYSKGKPELNNSKVENCSLFNEDKEGKQTLAATSVNENSKQRNSDSGSDVAPVEMPAPDPAPLASDPCNTSAIKTDLFAGKYFTITGFGPEEVDILSSMVKLHSGNIVESPSVKMPDIAIVPVIWNDLSIKAGAIVTNCWLQKCIEDKKLFRFDENELFSPFDIEPHVHPLQNLVISFSQYAGTERDCLMHLAEVLGARCQEYFVRKPNAAKGLLPNTHLVVAQSEGSKYEASKKWNIPAVTKYWLLAAAKEKANVPIDKYLCGIEVPKESTFFNDIVCLSKNISADNKIADLIAENVDAGNKVVVQSKEVQANEKFATPNAVVRNNRIKELIDHNRSLTPKGDIPDEFASPGRVQDSSFKAQFDVSGIMRALDTTSGSDCSDAEIRQKRASISLNEAISRNLAFSLNRFANPVEDCRSPLPSPHVINSNKKIFDGVVLCVSRKLGTIQLDMNKLVVSLGGEFRWTFDHSCTHYVFQGKANDLNKEFREARRLGKKIISPEWVYDCKESNTRLPEGLYPHTFKSKMSLSEISTNAVPANSSSKYSDHNENKTVASDDNVNEAAKLSDKNEGNPEKNSSFDVGKELDELIVAAKSAKKCRTRRNASSSIESPMGNNDKSVKRTPTSSPAIANVYLNANAENDIVVSEPSQTFPITWDDPTGRMEREKIAANDARNSKSDCEDAKMGDVKDDRLLINDDQPDVMKQPVVRKFMFTSVTDEEKQKFAAIITRLGGTVSDLKSFDDTATHLIASQPIKNEKFLASVASGKWVLHKSYIDDSATNDSFLAEEKYEFGSGFQTNFTLNKSALEISSCPHRWRLKILESNHKPFDSWKVLVIADHRHRFSYEKILHAGGAEVIPTYSRLAGITHAFVEAKKNTDLSHELELLFADRVKCIKPEYLALYLTKDPPPSEQDHLISDFINSSHISIPSKRDLQLSTREQRKKFKRT